MSALRQHDGLHAGLFLRGGGFRRAGTSLAYVDPQETFGTTGGAYYLRSPAGCFTGTREVYSGVLISSYPSGPARALSDQPFAEQITRELDRLTDGWFGPGSKAPGREILRDLDVVLSQLLSDAPKPEVEIDEDTGAVTLCWGSADGVVTLALVFNGDHNVVAVKTTVGPAAVATSKVFGIAELTAIDRFLTTDKAVAALLAA